MSARNDLSGARTAPDTRAASIQRFLGSAHIFASTVHDVGEEQLLGRIAGQHAVTFQQYRLLRLVVPAP